MISIYKYAITTAILSLTTIASFGQRSSTPPKQTPIEEIPRVAIDTFKTATPGTSIILYSNNTWRYLRTDTLRLSKHKAFKENWDTTQVFAYKVDYTIIPSIVELNLIDSLSQFHTPLKGKVISAYGRRGRSNHNGVDVPAPKGTPVYATFNGKVRYAKYNTGGYGYLVIIRHTNGLESWHGHFSRLNVEPNDYVKAGDIIGYVGNTGRSRGNHLHYELRYRDQTFDPEFVVDFSTNELRYKVFALEKKYFDIHSHASEILQDAEDDYVLAGSLLVDSADSVAIHAAMNAGAKKGASTATISQSNAVYHTVKSGDILGRIALKYGVSIDQICRLNNMKRTETLKLGRKLRIK